MDGGRAHPLRSGRPQRSALRRVILRYHSSRRPCRQTPFPSPWEEETGAELSVLLDLSTVPFGGLLAYFHGLKHHGTARYVGSQGLRFLRVRAPPFPRSDPNQRTTGRRR